MVAAPTALLQIFVLAQLVAPAPRPVLPQADPSVARASVHQNRIPAGRLVRGTLGLSLDIVESAWRPEGADDPEVPILAFAESGRTPTVPGPLIRVRRGTPMLVTLRNRTAYPLVVRGLRPGAPLATDTLHLPAGEAREVRHVFDSVGTFYYAGAFRDRPPPFRGWKTSQLAGAIVVDAPGVRTDDHILVLNEWLYRDATPRAPESAMVINGKGWPHSQTLQLQQGDSARFRVINLIGFHHPMHLHGFFYRIESRGDGRRDVPVPLEQQPLSNTDLITSRGTYTLSFLASTPGNWLYHCHFAFHIDEGASLHGAPTDAASKARQHDAHEADGVERPDEHMRGLVMGIQVKPRPGYAGPPTAGAREVHLYAQERPGVLEAGGTLQSYVLQHGAEPPARDSVVFPSSVIELERGKPARIVVHNNLREPTAVHWHGLEIESFPDGVPRWSGIGEQRFTEIAPSASFAAEFTPPRAGTYPYHTHFNDRRQMVSGLYGALLVTDGPRDLAHDHLIVIGGAGPWVESFFESPYGAVNGSTFPAPLRLVAGETHRLRLVMLHPDWAVGVTLQNDSTVARWTPIAKDGADLPPALRQPTLARTQMGPGQTYDYAFTPTEPGEWVVHVAADGGGWYAAQRITVVPKAAD